MAGIFGLPIRDDENGEVLLPVVGPEDWAKAAGLAVVGIGLIAFGMSKDKKEKKKKKSK